ncbi:hypothetical protein J31TS3_44440 [Paenibacillus lactis]|nr:hypothetical protein J31TS3_44440 [Paenibacillus lactis]
MRIELERLKKRYEDAVMPLWIAAPPVMTMGEAAIKSFEESWF